MEDATLDSLRRRLAGVRQGPIDLRLGARGTFGGRRHARVIWLGVEDGTPGLAGLAAQIEQVCRAAGLSAEERPFRAHLTLARAAGRGGAELPELPEPPPLPPWRAGEFVLYESRLGRGPATYLALERYPLSP